MKYTKAGSTYFIRLDKGEEVLEQIRSVCEKERIALGTVSGLGACNDITIGLFETGTKEYHTATLSGDHELVGLTGNITMMDGEIYLHVHAMFADAAYHVRGGHLNKAVVSATGEIILEALDGKAGRRFSAAVGLNLLSFE